MYVLPQMESQERNQASVFIIDDDSKNEGVAFKIARSYTTVVGNPDQNEMLNPE
jgi:hypothetical protein